MAGTLTISTLSDGTNSTSSTNCIQGSAKAWVNFNGTTSPGTIRAQYNVSSITKNGTGDYTLNFTTAMPDGNYAVVGTGMGFSTESSMICVRTTNYSSDPVLQSTSQVRIGSWIDDGTPYDISLIYVSVFR